MPRATGVRGAATFMDRTCEHRTSSRAVRFAPELGSGSPSARFARDSPKNRRGSSLAARCALRILAASRGSVDRARHAAAVRARGRAAAGCWPPAAPSGSRVGRRAHPRHLRHSRRPATPRAPPSRSAPTRADRAFEPAPVRRRIRALAAALPLSSRPLAVAPRETVSRATRSNVARSRASAARRAKSSRQSRSAEKVRGSSACRAARRAEVDAIRAGAARRSKASWNGRSGSFPRRNRSALRSGRGRATRAAGTRAALVRVLARRGTRPCGRVAPRRGKEAFGACRRTARARSAIAERDFCVVDEPSARRTTGVMLRETPTDAGSRGAGSRAEEAIAHLRRARARRARPARSCATGTRAGGARRRPGRLERSTRPRRAPAAGRGVCSLAWRRRRGRDPERAAVRARPALRRGARTRACASPASARARAPAPRGGAAAKPPRSGARSRARAVHRPETSDASSNAPPQTRARPARSRWTKSQIPRRVPAAVAKWCQTPDGDIDIFARRRRVVFFSGHASAPRTRQSRRRARKDRARSRRSRTRAPSLAPASAARVLLAPHARRREAAVVLEKKVARARRSRSAPRTSRVRRFALDVASLGTAASLACARPGPAAARIAPPSGASFARLLTRKAGRSTKPGLGGGRSIRQPRRARRASSRRSPRRDARARSAVADAKGASSTRGGGAGAASRGSRCRRTCACVDRGVGLERPRAPPPARLPLPRPRVRRGRFADEAAGGVRRPRAAGWSRRVRRDVLAKNLSDVIVRRAASTTARRRRVGS